MDFIIGKSNMIFVDSMPANVVDRTGDREVNRRKLKSLRRCLALHGSG
jgi:hypothetical protein